MERVTFVLEATGDRISALLNPESLEMRRASGLRRRSGAGGVVMGGARTDDPLIATGGGTTEYDLYLLFDTEVAREAVSVRPRASAPVLGSQDVRELTRPLWNLSENAAEGGGSSAPPTVRFIWGKAWNVAGVVTAVAERLEQFDAAGTPQRSWLSLRLRRVEERAPLPPAAAPTSPQFETPALAAPAESDGAIEYDSVTVAADEQGVLLNRLYLIAAERFGDPSYARAIARFNGLDDMLRMPRGGTLMLPPASVLAQYV
ncbi:CIS tube protein [Sphingomonas sp. DT-204]|uniref:CIS tube protein n=1 Tax=Sphingomonas sp. DT-204 TaxID=3396166 RepID=UPI003F1ACD9A